MAQLYSGLRRDAASCAACDLRCRPTVSARRGFCRTLIVGKMGPGDVLLCIHPKALTKNPPPVSRNQHDEA